MPGSIFLVIGFAVPLALLTHVVVQALIDIEVFLPLTPARRCAKATAEVLLIAPTLEQGRSQSRLQLDRPRKSQVESPWSTGGIWLGRFGGSVRFTRPAFSLFSMLLQRVVGVEAPGENCICLWRRGLMRAVDVDEAVTRVRSDVVAGAQG